MEAKKIWRNIFVPGLVGLGLTLVFNSTVVVIICPLMGILGGIPGVVGCALGTFISELVGGRGIPAAVILMSTAALIALVSFFWGRLLKDKNRFKTAWLFLALINIVSIVTSIVVAVLFYIFDSTGSTTQLLTGYVAGSPCIAYTIGYPIFFLVKCIRERDFKIKKPLLVAYVCWLPIQYAFIILFGIKVYAVNINTPFTDLNILQGWWIINVLFGLLNILVLLLATLTGKFKRVMLFVFAGAMAALSIYNIITFDTGVGLYIVIVIALCLFLHAVFYNWYEQEALKKKIVKIVTTVLHLALLAVFVLYFALSISTYIIPRANGDEKYVIVLGAPVYNNEPTAILEDRIIKASDFLNSNIEAYAVLTGGTKVEGGKTEAEVMRDGIVARGVSPERLILECEAQTTQENFEKCMEIIKENGCSEDDEIVIITSSFHLLRAGIYARKAGFNKITSKGANSFFLKDWVWYLRESITILPLVFGS